MELWPPRDCLSIGAPENKVGQEFDLIEAFNKNVEMRELDKQSNGGDKKMNDKMKDAFSPMLASLQGGGIRNTSPSRKYRKWIECLNPIYTGL